MTKNLEPWVKLLSSVASILFAVIAAAGIDTTNNLLFAILFYMWGRDG
jgi:Mor family transcriptional regulator